MKTPRKPNWLGGCESLAGMALLTLGCYGLSAPLAWIVLGLLLIVDSLWTKGH